MSHRNLVSYIVGVSKENKLIKCVLLEKNIL